MSDEHAGVGPGERLARIRSGPEARGMNESKVAIAGLLQLHAMHAGADQAAAADLVMRVMAEHAGEVRSWDWYQQMVARVRGASDTPI